MLEPMLELELALLGMLLLAGGITERLLVLGMLLLAGGITERLLVVVGVVAALEFEPVLVPPPETVVVVMTRLIEEYGTCDPTPAITPPLKSKTAVLPLLELMPDPVGPVSKVILPPVLVKVCATPDSPVSAIEPAV
jgi:hypothetical protein